MSTTSTMLFSGSLASTVVYGALGGATDVQIEEAIGMLLSHFIPWRAVRSSRYDLSDSLSSSSAFMTEQGIICMNRVMAGFRGPKDIFRNPEACFNYFWNKEGTDSAPFDITLNFEGENFAVMKNHFRFGCYAGMGKWF
jgi:2-methylcitrate dehydratase